MQMAGDNSEKLNECGSQEKFHYDLWQCRQQFDLCLKVACVMASQ